MGSCYDVCKRLGMFFVCWHIGGRLLYTLYSQRYASEREHVWAPRTRSHYQKESTRTVESLGAAKYIYIIYIICIHP